MHDSAPSEQLPQPAGELPREPTSSQPSRLRGYGMIAAAACMWSLGGCLVKYLTQTHHVAPQALVCLRSAVGGLVLSWALPGITRAPRWRVAGAGIAYTGVVGGFVMATVGTSAANAIILQYAYPLLVAAGAVFILKEALGRRTILSLGLGMAGIATILIFSWSPHQSGGLIYGLASAFAFAALTLFQASIREGNPLGLSSFYNLSAAALMLPFAYDKLHVPLIALLIIGVMGTVQLSVPYFLFFKGLRSVPSTDAALITLLEPVLNPVWVWLIIGETPQACTLVGGVLILAALIVRFLGIRSSEADT